MNPLRPERFSAFLPLILLSLLTVVAAAAAADVNRIVLRVNDRIATLYDYEALKQERIASLERADISPERRQEILANLGEATMRELYEELLVLSRADQLAVEVGEQAIQQALERTKASFGIETEEDFTRALEQSGMTRADLREQMKKNLMIRDVIGREVHPRVELKDEDLRRYYQANLEDFRVPEKVELRELVVLDREGADPGEQAAFAAGLRESIAAGTLSDEVLDRYREDGVVAGWIDLGWVERGDLDPSLEEVAWGLEKGGLSEAVPARGGLHLLQATDREEARIREFEEVRSQIEGQVGSRKFREELGKYMRELEDRSFIVFQPPPDAAGFRPDASGPADEGLGGFADPLAPAAPAAAPGGAGEDSETAAETPPAEAAAGETGDAEAPESEPESEDPAPPPPSR